jgi:hypothetical protein
MESLNNRTYTMPEADIKPFFPAQSVLASKRFPHSEPANNKAVTTFIAVICFLMAANINAQTLEWVKVVGGNGFIKGNSIAIDDDGNFYITGVFLNTNDWEKPGSLFTLDGGKIFVQKLDAKGKFLWTKFFGGNKCDKGNSIAIDEGGNIYTTGYFNDIVDFSPGVDSMKLASAGENDVFIQKLDANGNFLWVKNFDDYSALVHQSRINTSAIAIDGKGNVYKTGNFKGTIDFDPGKDTAKLYARGDDIFIQKLDANGDFLWAISFTGTYDSESTISSITVDAQDNIYTTGYFERTVDFDPGQGEYNITSEGERDVFIHKMKETATGVADMGNGIDISLYPNPSNGFIHIALNEAVGEAAITVTDLQGKIIHSEHMSAATKSSIDIQAPNGVYFIHVQTANGQSIMKFIKE